jgi:uncharacterized delta-60 repeat protein
VRIKMKLIYVLLFILFYNTTFTAQTKQNEIINSSANLSNVADSVIQNWVSFYNGPGNDWDEALAITVDGSNNIYVTGGSPGSGTQKDFATIKYNPSGSEEWTARYNGPGNGDDEARAIAVDNSGNVYVTGYSAGSGSFDYATVKYNSSGTEVWTARFNGTANSDDQTTSIAVDNSGNVYITGYSTGLIYDYDYVTIKYDSAGAEQWHSAYNGPGNFIDYACKVAVDDSGNVYTAGWSGGSNGFNDYATVKYNSLGVQQWVSRYHGPQSEGDDACYGMTIGCDGNIYVTGGSISESGDRDYLTVKYNNSGEQQWTARYDGSINDFDVAMALTVDCSGNVYVTGKSAGINSSLDYLTIKYNSSGEEDWTARYNGPANSEDGATVINIDNNDNVYVAGISAGLNSGFDYTIIKYTPDGSEEWISQFNGTDNGDDWLTGIALDGDNNIIATGYTFTSSSSFDYATVKYNQQIIPVELTSFTAFAIGNNVMLNWRTSTETNNLGFEVQRSNIRDQRSEAGGQKPDWENVGFVGGFGTTTEPKSYSFTDNNLQSGNYTYRLKQIDFDGSFNYTNEVEVEVETQDFASIQFSLSQNYPNPFNPATQISYSIPKDGYVSLKVYNTLGQEVANLVNELVKAGNHQVKFSAKDGKLSSGVYYYRIETAENVSVKKMILIR